MSNRMCWRCDGRKVIPAGLSSWSDCPVCHGTGMVQMQPTGWRRALAWFRR